MKKSILLLTMLVMILTTGIAQTITTGNVTSPICAGATISIPYTVTGTFSFNTFYAQLSNSSGSFTTPVVLASLTSNVSGTFTATIPYGLSGSGYKIRVVSNSPAIISSNETALTINANPNNKHQTSNLKPQTPNAKQSSDSE